MRGDSAQGELFAAQPEVGEDGAGSRGHRVAVRPDPTGRGYALFDIAGRRLFGTLRFSTEAAAEAYLAEANREARWVKWHLVHPARKRPKARSRPSQLGLFGDE